MQYLRFFCSHNIDKINIKTASYVLSYLNKEFFHWISWADCWKKITEFIPSQKMLCSLGICFSCYHKSSARWRSQCLHSFHTRTASATFDDSTYGRLEACTKKLHGSLSSSRYHTYESLVFTFITVKQLVISPIKITIQNQLFSAFWIFAGSKSHQ